MNFHAVCFIHVWYVGKEMEQNSRKCLPKGLYGLMDGLDYIYSGDYNRQLPDNNRPTQGKDVKRIKKIRIN